MRTWVAVGFLMVASEGVRAQSAVAGPALPESPAVSVAEQVPGQGAAELRGTVKDSRDARVSNAAVTLTLGNGTARRVRTDAQGQFRFLNLPAGQGTLTVQSSGLSVNTLSLNLAAGQVLDLDNIVMGLTGLQTEVQVTASSSDIGAAQVQAEEKQRVLGLFPNYFVTYAGDPVPLTTKQKFHITTRLQFDPVTLLGSAFAAGIEQATNAFPGYGQGAAGYGKRVGASLADGLTANYLAGAIYPTIFRQDPRYFYLGPKYGKWHRVGYALASSVRAKSDKGKWVPNYSNVLGDLTSGAISNAYYPASDRHGFQLTLENTGIGVGFSAVGSLFQEFLIHKLTPGLPDYGAGGKQ